MSVHSLGQAAWTDLEGKGPHRLLIPVGSLEQHGPHLPLSTDTDIAGHVAQRVRAELNASAPEVATWWTTPPIWTGASGEHEGFPGTLSIGTAALTHLLIELGRSATRFAERVILVNGHGGNVQALRAACTLLISEGRHVSWVPCAPVDDPSLPGDLDAHAGYLETSIQLALQPEQVRSGALEVGATEPLATLLPRLTAHGVRAVSHNGILGDPRAASAADGRVLLETMVTRVLERIRRSEAGADGMLQDAPR